VADFKLGIADQMQSIMSDEGGIAAWFAARHIGVAMTLWT